MKYMLMMNAPRGGGDWDVASWPPNDLKAHIAFMIQFATNLSEAGELVAAEGLAPPAMARVVHMDKGRGPEVTDGPFAETKEQLGGYHLVECRDLDEALCIAARIPTLSAGGAIEVRPFMPSPEKTKSC